MIVPDRFIPLAEESGLISSIGEWVISRVCAQFRRWVDAGLPDVRVSLNVSARQLDRLALHRFIGDAIRANGIEPSTLEVEVTETSILRQHDRRVIAQKRQRRVTGAEIVHRLIEQLELPALDR